MAVKDLNALYKPQLTVGVENADVVDVISPYTTGVVYLFWTRLPKFVDRGFNEVTRVLQNQVQIPGYTLNAADGNMGFNGTGKIYAPTTLDADNTMTVSYNEQMDLPTLKNIKNWVFSIRDPQSGLSIVSDYSLKNITGDLLVIFTKPVMYSQDAVDNNLIQETMLFTKASPTTVPMDILNSSKDASDKVLIDVPFKFQDMVMSDDVRKLAEEKLASIATASKWNQITVH